MVALTEEKISNTAFVQLGSLVFDSSRGMLFAGAKRVLPERESHGFYRVGDFVIVTQTEEKPHVGLGFSLIGGKIVWSEGSGDHGYTVCREDGLRHPAYYIYPYRNCSGKLLFVGQDQDRKKKFIWCEGETGPECKAIHDLVLTSHGFGYTAWPFEGGFNVMLNHQKFGSHDLSHKLFEHNGKLGYVVQTSFRPNTEQVYFDGQPYSDPTKEVWQIGTLNGRLVHAGQTGSLFCSGQVEKGQLAGWPTYDLTKDFGHPCFVDTKYVGTGKTFHYIPLGNSAIAFNLEHSEKLLDENKYAEVVVVEGEQLRRINLNGTGYIFDVGGKVAYVQSYGKGKPKVFLEEQLVVDGHFALASGFDAVLDVDGKIGTVGKNKEEEVYPIVDGAVSGEPLPDELGYDQVPSPICAFGGNVVFRCRSFYRPRYHLSVGGRKYGPLQAVSNLVSKDDCLKCVVSKEDGTYLWTFTK